jgi:hypothetical protein
MNESEAETEESPGRRTDLDISVCANGVSNVHRPESDRAHSVFLGAHGDVTRCSCKGHRFHGHCAHADAVDARPLVTASAQAAAASTPRVATDGGVENPTGGDESAENGGESAPDGDTDGDGGTDAAAGLGTVTGWESGERTVDGGEDVDETPL